MQPQVLLAVLRPQPDDHAQAPHPGRPSATLRTHGRILPRPARAYAAPARPGPSAANGRLPYARTPGPPDGCRRLPTSV
ncbi:hypothetical protein [Streptomyces lydicus]|uniref:hypothetical protein n=1 Tax=Streptomyces lydicus TaxID=47763 RepID=UPI0036A4CE37